MLDTFSPNGLDVRPTDWHCYLNSTAAVACFAFIITKTLWAVYKFRF